MTCLGTEWLHQIMEGFLLVQMYKTIRTFTNANLNDSSLSYKNNLTLVSLNFSFNISGLLFWEISERKQTRNWSGFHSSSTSRMTQPPTLIRHLTDKNKALNQMLLNLGLRMRKNSVENDHSVSKYYFRSWKVSVQNLSFRCSLKYVDLWHLYFYNKNVCV